MRKLFYLFGAMISGRLKSRGGYSKTFNGSSFDAVAMTLALCDCFDLKYTLFDPVPDSCVLDS